MENIPEITEAQASSRNAQQKGKEHEGDYYSDGLLRELRRDVNALRELRDKTRLFSKYVADFSDMLKEGKVGMDAFLLAPEIFTSPTIDLNLKLASLPK